MNPPAVNSSCGLCGISVDVDSISSHLRGYGMQAAADRDEHLLLAVPRAIELFSKLRVQATFFLIAAEAKRTPEIVRLIVESGHEVACHSMTHSLPFNPCGVEVADSKSVLEDLSGKPVVGFRAPSWDFGPDLFEMLAAAGYRYDASAFPSWMLMLYRLSVKKRRSSEPGAAAGKPIGMPSLQKMFGKPGPHRLRPGLIELPVTTAVGVRIPWYHTLNFLLPPPFFAIVQRLALLRRGPVQYVFHAVDFLGLDEDRIDPQLICHPGMNQPLTGKLARISELLTAVGTGRRMVTLAEIAGSLSD